MIVARHGGIRTRDAQFRKLSLYPAELRAPMKLYFQDVMKNRHKDIIK